MRMSHRPGNSTNIMRTIITCSCSNADVSLSLSLPRVQSTMRSWGVSEVARGRSWGHKHKQTNKQTQTHTQAPHSPLVPTHGAAVDLLDDVKDSIDGLVVEKVAYAA